MATKTDIALDIACGRLRDAIARRDAAHVASVSIPIFKPPVYIDGVVIHERRVRK